MGLSRRSRRGFSLTEILMAVGILGIGLTMVASIFPVAVDQTRRGTDATMAALCARSMAALIRAKRADFFSGPYGFRDFFVNKAIADLERPAEFGVGDQNTTAYPSLNPGIIYNTAQLVIPREMRVYSPNLFLYEAGHRYVIDSPTTNPYWPWWNAGNYIPVVYVTPIVAQKDRNSTTIQNPGGPWRVTIVVFKSRGTETFHPRLKNWNQLAYNTATGEPAYAAEAGAYIIDRNIHAGEAYRVDLVNADPQRSVNGVPGSRTNPPIYLASGIRANTTTTTGSRDYITGSSTMRWYILPGAVGAFHTIIGE
jgi:prepilin-type N-terminal cleavage/methylation domain-containing protein